MGRAIVLLVRGRSARWMGFFACWGVAGGLTRLSYAETLGNANPSAYPLWSSTAIDIIFLVGGLLFTRAAALAGKHASFTRAGSRPRR